MIDLPEFKSIYLIREIVASIITYFSQVTATNEALHQLINRDSLIKSNTKLRQCCRLPQLQAHTPITICLYVSYKRSRDKNMHCSTFQS
jgi:hypothetical protein